MTAHDQAHAHKGHTEKLVCACACVCIAHYVGIEPRLDDDLTDTGFATDVAARQDAGPYIASVGSGCVHLRLQMLFRVRALHTHTHMRTHIVSKNPWPCRNKVPGAQSLSVLVLTHTNTQ